MLGDDREIKATLEAVNSSRAIADEAAEVMRYFVFNSLVRVRSNMSANF